MTRLHPDQLHVVFLPGVRPDGPIVPRRYTLTHSDRTGDLFLAIGPTYHAPQIAGWYTRLMRDEVLGEWLPADAGHALHLYLHVSGGLVVGRAAWRAAIFRRELPLVIAALRAGDRELFAAHPALDDAPIPVHFHTARPREGLVEDWGPPKRYT